MLSLYFRRVKSFILAIGERTNEKINSYPPAGQISKSMEFSPENYHTAKHKPRKVAQNVGASPGAHPTTPNKNRQSFFLWPSILRVKINQGGLDSMNLHRDLPRWASVLIKLAVGIVLLAIPMFYKISYRVLYYIYVGIVLAFGLYRELALSPIQRDNHFHQHWGKARKNPYGVNLIRQSLLSLVFFVLQTIVILVFVHGVTPVDVLTKLTNGQLVITMLCYLAFSTGIGAVRCHEKEIRFHRIEAGRATTEIQPL